MENVECKQLMPTETYDTDLNGACSGYWLIQTCPPFYFSVQGVSTATTQNSYQCSDVACRFPDSIKYRITVENLGCHSSAQKIAAHIIIVVFSIAFAAFY